jgi:hypothetical protein
MPRPDGRWKSIVIWVTKIASMLEKATENTSAEPPRLRGLSVTAPDLVPAERG